MKSCWTWSTCSRLTNVYSNKLFYRTNPNQLFDQNKHRHLYLSGSLLSTFQWLGCCCCFFGWDRPRWFKKNQNRPGGMRISGAESRKRTSSWHRQRGDLCIWLCSLNDWVRGAKWTSLRKEWRPTQWLCFQKLLESRKINAAAFRISI